MGTRWNTAVEGPTAPDVHVQRAEFARASGLLDELDDLAANLGSLREHVAGGQGIGLGHPAFWAMRRIDGLLTTYQNDIGRGEA